MTMTFLTAASRFSGGKLVLSGVLFLVLLALCAAVYLYIQKLKAAQAEALSQKDKQIQQLQQTLAETRRKLPPAPMNEAQILAAFEPALAAGEFQFFLQPEVDQFTQEIVGAEALARWVRPGKGTYTPGAFIPVLERHGLVRKLDRYIFEQVCQFQQNRLKKHLPVVPICVNFSRVDLEDADLLDHLAKVFRQYNVAPSMVPLEIAASAFADDIDWLSTLVTKLQEDSFSVSIDNLGKNELSLDILKDIPSDFLKLDTKSIREGLDDERSRQLVSSVLRMGHMASKNILAGNVETNEQANQLKYIGFRNAQGFHYHKPMPSQDFEKLLASKK